MSPAPVIAVDGPVGVGKGALCHRLAAALGYHLLDSGALYRLVALAARRAGTDLGDAGALAREALALDVRFEAGEAADPVRPLLGGEDVSRAIRTEQCGGDASRVAGLEPVRAALLERQRSMRRPPGLVADGRDMGTVVFPDAGVKIFLEASPEERARRRHKQLKEKGISVSLASLLTDISERDRRDRERAVAPLEPASDAVVIDTTGIGIDAVVERALALAGAAGLGPDART